MERTRIFSMPFSSIYPLYIQKAEKKEEQKKKLMKLYFGLPAMMKIHCSNN